MKIYVGNLDSKATSEELLAMFEAFGAVSKADVHCIGSSGAFGRLEMPDSKEAHKAIQSLSQIVHRGQKLVVAECLDHSDLDDDESDDEEFEDKEEND